MSVIRSSAGLALQPSILIREALEDLHKAEQSTDYRVKMTLWHRPAVGDPQGTSRGPCAVCLAGASIAFRAGDKTTPGMALTPAFFNADTENLLYALNSARTGQWDRFARLISYAYDAMLASADEETLARMTGYHGTIQYWDRRYAVVRPGLNALGHAPPYGPSGKLAKWLHAAADVWERGGH